MSQLAHSLNIRSHGRIVVAALLALRPPPPWCW